MKEIPILFSTPMVQALLAGRKTQTRRIIQMDDLLENPGRFRSCGDSRDHDVCRPGIKYDDRIWFQWELKNSNAASWIERCRWKPKDILWVREAFRKYFHVDKHGYTKFDDERIEFAADNPEPIVQMDGDGFLIHNKDGSEKIIPWKPSIHMPKIAARIWMEVVNVRVERLHDITDEDAISEGIQRVGDSVKGGFKDYMDVGPSPWMHARNSFFSLWQSINGTESLTMNPWVWVIEFKILSTTGKPKESAK